MTAMLTSPSGTRMLGYWPLVYRDSRILHAVYQANGKEIDDLDDLTEEVRLQLHPRTATWGLKIWEEALGFPVIESQPLELRRAKVESRLLTQFPMTTDKMKQIVNQFIPSRIATIDVFPSRYSFQVKVPISDIGWFSEMREAVDYAKPAHLTFIFAPLSQEVMEIKECITVNLRRYHKVHEFRVGMKPMKYQNQEVL